MVHKRGENRKKIARAVKKGWGLDIPKFIYPSPRANSYYHSACSLPSSASLTPP